MEKIEKELQEANNKVLKGSSYAVAIIGETGTGKTRIVRNFFEKNKINYYIVPCNTLVPEGKRNPFGYTTNELLNINLGNNKAVFFDMFDCCEESVREKLFDKVKELKQSNDVLIVATAWPTAHFSRNPIEKERFEKVFDTIITIE